MKLARTLLSYTLAIGVLCGALIGGAMWLIAPGPAVSHEARIAPIPPRLAESIERKKPLPVRAPEPEAAKPPEMKEAAVSLAPAPVRAYRIRELTPPVRQKRKPRGEQGVAQAAAPAAAVPVVTTARSDFPY